MLFDRRRFNQLLLMAVSGSMLPAGLSLAAEAAGTPRPGGTLTLLYPVDPGSLSFCNQHVLWHRSGDRSEDRRGTLYLRL